MSWWGLSDMAGAGAVSGKLLMGAARPSRQSWCCRAGLVRQHCGQQGFGGLWPRRLRVLSTSGAGAGDERGSSVVEFVLLTSVVMVLLGFLPIQAGLWWHERHLLSAAAGEAALAASVAGADSAEAENQAAQAAARFLETSQVASLSDVSVWYQQEVVQVAVTGEAITAVPGVRWTMTGRAQAPVERFVAR